MERHSSLHPAPPQHARLDAGHGSPVCQTRRTPWTSSLYGRKNPTTHIPVDIKLTLCLMCTVQLPLSLGVKFHEQAEHVKTSASASEQKIF